MNKSEVKRYAVYLNIILFCAVVWYCIAELILTIIWRFLWHYIDLESREC